MEKREEDKRKLLFLFNPNAGKGRAKAQLWGILEALSGAGYLVTAYPTSDKNDAFQLMKGIGSEFDRVVCCGGDGTLNETIRGLLAGGHDVPIGHIPGGSTNDYAFSLGLPRHMAEAARVAAEGVPFRCDVGAFNETYFVYVAAFGAFAETSYTTPQQAKNILGHLAYVLEALSRLPRLPSYQVRVEYENTLIEDEFILGMVTNSLSVGGMKGIMGKDVRLNDGLFEVLLIKRPSNLAAWRRVISAALRQDFARGDFYSFTASELCFTSQESLAWTLDGEYGGTVSKAEIRNCPSAVEMIVDGDSKETKEPLPED